MTRVKVKAKIMFKTLKLITGVELSQRIIYFQKGNIESQSTAPDSSPVAFKYKSGRAARSGRVEAHGKGERRKFSYFSPRLPFSPCARPPLVLIYI